MLLGKILRIDPRHPPRSVLKKIKRGERKRARRAKKNGKKPRARGTPKIPRTYTIPKDNPFVGRPGRDEICAYGLRNPWRFCFDRGPQGPIAIGDVGDVRYEEINILPVAKARGANFGWSAFEGPRRLSAASSARAPSSTDYAYAHGRRCSVVGGYVVRDPRLSRIKGREIVGRYIFGDFCGQRIFAFRPRRRQGRPDRSFRFKIPGVTSFAEDRDGRIYVLTYQGPVYRLDPIARRSRVCVAG